jgi:uncharacterized protein YdgA (DUF945 family)
MRTSTSRSGLIAAGTTAVLLLGWLGAAAWTGKRAEAALQALTSTTATDGANVRLTKLSHEPGWLSSRGKAEIALIDDCSDDLAAGDDPQPLATVEYNISHWPLPSGLSRFAWSAAPAGDAAQDLRALIGSDAKLTGQGRVSLNGQISSDVSIPELSRRRTGLKLAPSRGAFEVGSKSFKFEWNLERFGVRSGGEAIDLRSVSVLIDLTDRHLGTGTYTVSMEKASLSSGSAEGMVVRAQTLERGDRLDSSASYTAKKLSWGEQELGNITFDLSVTGVDLQSAERLNALFRSSCGFRNMTNDEQKAAKQAVSQLLARGLSAGISKFAASSEDGSFDGRLSVEMAPSNHSVPSLERQLRAEGELAMVIKGMTPDQRQALLEVGFEPLRETGLRARFRFKDGRLTLNDTADTHRAEVATLMAGLREADQALAEVLSLGKSAKASKGILSDALTSALPNKPASSGPPPLQAQEPSPQAAAALPRCRGDYDPQTWTDCVGSRITSAGDQYSGGYLNGKAHGQGAYTFADGRKYVGHYDQGLRHGTGTEFRPDGSVASQGRWSQGQFVGL